jgi:RNA polymerase sigma-B factor
VHATRRQDPLALFERYRDSGAARDRELLVRRYTPLARNLAARYACGREPFDDLFQVACLGLLKAIDGYDLDRGGAFTSYAVPTILGELKRHFRDKTWVVRVPHRLHDLAMRVRKAMAELWQQLGREPSAAELARFLDAGESEIAAALDALAVYDVVSLETPRNLHGRGLDEALRDEDDAFRQIERRSELDDLLACLTALERRALRLRFEDELTQTQIGDRLGISQMRVSRMLRRSLVRLRELAEQRGLSTA